MKNIKIIISIILAIFLTVNLCACSADTESAEPSESAAAEEGATVEESAEAEESASQKNETEEDEILIDNDDYLVTFTGLITGDDAYAVQLKIYVENKTDKEISFTCRNVSVNDMATSQISYMNSTIPAGKKANVLVNIMDKSFGNNIAIENAEFDIDIGIKSEESGGYSVGVEPYAGPIILTFEDNKLVSAEVNGLSENGVSSTDDSSDTATEEEINAALQGKWTQDALEGAYIEYKDGKSRLISSDGNSTEAGNYEIDTDEKVIITRFVAVDGTMKAYFPYEYKDGELTLYSNSDYEVALEHIQ